jgi:protein tyrosine phosphatase (PTP) superfamily phosphohydrolase (DUF442 family)
MTIDDETPKGKRDREQLQAIGRGLAAMLEHKAELEQAGIIFTLILADEGEQGVMTYCSSGERASMMKMLRELLDKLEVEAGADLINHHRSRS